MKITSYQGLCNLGNDIDTIYQKAINGKSDCFDVLDDYISTPIRVGLIKTELPEISSPNYNLRCNRLIKKCLGLLSDKISELKLRYSSLKIGVVAATTNSGVEEFEKSKNSSNYELGNPACFTADYLELSGYKATVSTACSSGIKAFSIAKDLIDGGVSDAVIVVCVDSLAKVPVYGFNSLGVLSFSPPNPFSKNREGMNIAEGCAIFIVEKKSDFGIDIMGIGESSDIYHPTTPNPDSDEVISAMKLALKASDLKPCDIDYINAHGTGTIANDIMEANAIYTIFSDKTPVSSTKSMTGHCLGASAGIETALCCKLLDSFDGRLYPNIYDGEFDLSLPEIKLVKTEEIFPKCKICMCNSFGFGGTNAIMILGKADG